MIPKIDFIRNDFGEKIDICSDKVNFWYFSVEFFVLYGFPFFKNNFYKLYRVPCKEMIRKISFIGTKFGEKKLMFVSIKLIFGTFF